MHPYRLRQKRLPAFLKTVAGLAQVKLRGTFRVWGAALIGLAAYNLTRA